jgi:hypothetical protein
MPVLKEKETRVWLFDSNDYATEFMASAEVSYLSIHFRYLDCSLHSWVRH